MFVLKNCRKLTPLLLAIVLQACCLAERLEFDLDELPPAVLNQVYRVIITASVNNSPNDDGYDYTLSFNGNLPAGLELIKDEERGRFIIQGTATEFGSFNFTLSARVSAKYVYSAEDDLLDIVVIETLDAVTEDLVCRHRYDIERTYTLMVSTI